MKALELFNMMKSDHHLEDDLYDAINEAIAELEALQLTADKLEHQVKALIQEREIMLKTHRSTVASLTTENTANRVLLNNSTLNCWLCEDCLKPKDKQ